MDSGDARLRLYLIGLLVAFGLYLLAHGAGAGLLLWIAGGLALAGLLASIVGSAAAGHPAIPAAAALAALLVCGWPLGATVLSGATTVPAYLHQQVVWPQILVLIFASRVFSEHARLRFAKAWLKPVSGAPAAPNPPPRHWRSAPV